MGRALLVFVMMIELSKYCYCILGFLPLLLFLLLFSVLCFLLL